MEDEHRTFLEDIDMIHNRSMSDALSLIGTAVESIR